MTDSLLDILEEAKAWHFEQFPDATYQGQLAKLEEELSEFHKEEEYSDAWYKELADVFIVLAGLSRWPSWICSTLRIYFNQFHYWSSNSDAQARLREEIKAKLEKNKARSWVQLPDGRFKHKTTPQTPIQQGGPTGWLK